LAKGPRIDHSVLVVLRVLVVVAILLAASGARADVSALPGTHWRLETDRGPIHVWMPDGYDPKTAKTVVFVHGYNTNVDSAWVEFKLREQFAASGLNAIFIACAAPAGKRYPVMWSSLPGLLATVSGGINLPLPHDVVAVGHSGAYRTLVHWLAVPALHTLVLLDAAYGEDDQFAAWTQRDAHHRLINVAADTVSESNWLHAFLPDTKRVDGLPAQWSDDARAAHVVYVRTGVGHMPLITDGVAMPMALRVLAP
jgi:hypothetical protein